MLSRCKHSNPPFSAPVQLRVLIETPLPPQATEQFDQSVQSDQVPLTTLQSSEQFPISVWFKAKVKRKIGHSTLLLGQDV